MGACQKADLELQAVDEDRLPGFFEDDCSMEPSSITSDQFFSTAFLAEKCLGHRRRDLEALGHNPEFNRQSRETRCRPVAEDTNRFDHL